MKKKNTELDVDFIGGQTGLTPQEEKALSEYFAKKKQVAQKRAKTRVANRSKTTA
ncbi:MAG: hypothetical protein KBB37_12780 [Bacteroidia bacterium]|jgi:hypothetical protein|nr:hypothetical protein [Bacteroidia bacterium]